MSTQADTYLFGMARGDITPPDAGPLGGYANRGVHVSEGTYLSLEVVVTYLSGGSTELLMVVADWLGFYHRSDWARARIASVTGVAPDHVLVLATHTHCGPAIRQTDAAWYGRIDEQQLAAAIELMASTAERAKAGARMCRLRLASGTSQIAMSRRRPDPDRPGRVLSGSHPNPDGVTDPNLPVLTAQAITGELAGLMDSYACHPTARAGLQFGGDFPGFTRRALRRTFPSAEVAFWQGCGGDQNPRPKDVGGPFGGRTVDQVRDLGEELAGAAEGAVQSGEGTKVRGSIQVFRTVLKLDTEPVAEAVVNYAASHPFPQLGEWARRARAGLADGPPLQRGATFEVVLIVCGSSLAIVAMAGEMTVEYGLRLKRELAGQIDAVLPLGYANGMVGYVPSRLQFAEGGYEVLDANLLYGRTGPWVAETEDVIHDAVAQMLADGLQEASEVDRA